VGLLEAPSVLTLIEGIVIVAGVLRGVGLRLARVVVSAMATAAREASAT
jgi:hypothetical protein